MNIIELYLFKYHQIIVFIILLFFPFEDHQIGKFSNKIDLGKLDFLSEEKIYFYFHDLK